MMIEALKSYKMKNNNYKNSTEITSPIKMKILRLIYYFFKSYKKKADLNRSDNKKLQLLIWKVPILIENKLISLYLNY